MSKFIASTSIIAFCALLLTAHAAQAANTVGCTQTGTQLGDLTCNAPTFPRSPDHRSVQIVNASGTTAQTLWVETSSLAQTTTNGSTAAGTNIIAVASISGIVQGMTAVLTSTGAPGSGLPAGCIVIAAPSAGNVPLSCLTTATITTATGISFFIASGWNGAKISGISCSNTDLTNAYTLTLQFLVAGNATPFVLETVSIPGGAGVAITGQTGATAGAMTPPLDLFNPNTVTASAGNSVPNAMNLSVDQQGNRYFTLNANETLQIASSTTVTSGKVISCHTTVVTEF